MLLRANIRHVCNSFVHFHSFFFCRATKSQVVDGESINANKSYTQYDVIYVNYVTFSIITLQSENIYVSINILLSLNGASEMYFIESKYLFKCTYIQGVHRNVSDKSWSYLLIHQMIKKKRKRFFQ